MTSRVARRTDRIVEVSILGLAIWTVAFHTGALLRWPIGVVLGLWVVGLGVAILLIRHRGSPPAPEPVEATVPSFHKVFGVLSLIGALVAVVALIFEADTVFWLPAAASVAFAWSAVRASSPAPRPASLPRGDWWVLALAVAAALHSAATTEWVPDNAYYVDRANAIAEGGPIPMGVDTMHSDGEYPSASAENDLASLEAIVGAASWVTGVHPMSLLSFVVHPLIAALGVLALWRVVRVLGLPHPELATVGGWVGVFLISRSSEFARVVHSSRTGRTVLLGVLVPIALAWAIDLARRPTPRGGWLLAAVAIAGVGMTLTSFVVLPLVVAVGLYAGWGRESRTKAWRGVVAPAVVVASYWVGVLVWARSLGRVTLTERSGVPEAGALWQTTLGQGSLYLLMTVAVLGVWALARSESARRLAMAAPAAVLILLAPPVMALLANTPAQTAPDRVLWILPLTVVFAIGVSGIAAWDPRWITAVALAAGAVIVVLVAPRGPDLRIGVPAWDVHQDRASAATLLASYADPGSTVAAPWEVAPFIGIVSTDVYPVAGRLGVVDLIGALDPSIDAETRRLLTGFVRTGRGLLPDQVGDALSRLDVTAACLGPRARSEVVRGTFSAAGFELVGEDGFCEYWVRSDPLDGP